MTLKHNLIINIVCIYSYKNLWCAPIVLVGHSFSGLIIKSLVVEIKRCMNQKTSNDMDLTMNEISKDFYDNLIGVIFYGTPHEGGTKTYSTYFAQICQETGFLNKTHSIPQQSLLNNVQCLNPNMNNFQWNFIEAKKILTFMLLLKDNPLTNMR